MKKMTWNYILPALCFSLFCGMGVYAQEDDASSGVATGDYYFEEVEEAEASGDSVGTFRNAAHYVRIYIPEEQTNYRRAELYEIRVYEVGSSDNIALGRPATASSTGHPLHSPSNATDGALVTKWSSGANQGLEEWFVVDLEDVYDVGRVNLIKSRRNFPSIFEIQVSLDGVTWTPFTSASKRKR